MSDPSPRDRFGFQFVTLARLWRKAVDAQLAAEGLNDARWAPLIHLSESGGGITQAELARRVGIDASTLVRLLDLLAGAGFVERRADPADRRARRLHLTPAGEEEVARTRERLIAIEARMLEGLDAATLARMSQAFEGIAQRAQALLAPEDGGPDRAGNGDTDV